MNKGFYFEDAIDVISEVLDSGASVRISPRGVSMRPLILEGKDSVRIKKYDREPRRLDIAFYRRDNGQFVLHRIVRTGNDGTYTMCGDHQSRLEKGIRRDQLIGYVEKIYKGDRPFDEESLKYKIYLFFWCCMPLRCPILFCRRCIGKIKVFFVKMFKKAID